MTTTLTLTLDLEEPESGFAVGGFYQEWISGNTGEDEPEATFGLTSGAGLGNPVMALWVERAGEDRRWFRADMAEFIERAVRAALDAIAEEDVR